MKKALGLILVLSLFGVAAFQINNTTGGTVTSVTFTGDGVVESSTPSAAVTTTGTVTATLANAAPGTVLGNSTGASTTPTYNAAVTLGVAGTPGSICLSGNTSGAPCFSSQATAGAINIVLPATGTQGVLSGVTNSGKAQLAFSGDTNHSATVTIGSGTSIGLTSLCSTTFCPVGTYSLTAYVDITTACGTSGTYTVLLTWTDDAGSKSAFTVPLTGTGTASGVLTTTTTANWGSATMPIRTTGAAAIQYSTTAVACGSAGPMVGKMYLSMTPQQ